MGSWWSGNEYVTNYQRPFELCGKGGWQLAIHRPCPITGDNMLSPVCTIFIATIMAGYDFDIAKFINGEIRE